MPKTIKYPVGIQTFSKIREENLFYIDKTIFIKEIINSSDYVFLIRPRRFGKSLLMSTLEAYFKGRKELFEGLAISELETEWKTYPVFRFDLSPANYINIERLRIRLDGNLNFIEKDYGLSSEARSPQERFMELIRQAFEKYGQKVVILIDEYDKPILDCLHNQELLENIKSELRSFYSVIKGNDEYIRFAMLTGVSKFGKVSVFSGLNNLKDISMLPKFNSVCGISESEFKRDFKKSVTEFSEENDLTEDETWESFKRLYDGYHFAKKGKFVYNPFSLLSAFDSEDFNHYWFSTGSPSYLIKLIKKNGYLLADLDGVRRNEAALNDMTDSSRDLVPLLYQAGYLTIKSYESLTRQYTLGFPNREVYEGFWDSLSNYFLRGYGGRTTFDLFSFLGDIRDGNIEGFMIRLQSLFADTDSMPEINKEIHFQNLMAIVCKMLGLEVRTEIHSSRGRCDMQILTDHQVFIFEFKVDGSAEKALRQIKEKGYATPFGSDS
ncbi:MAG: ATP-binding protein, partial [Muribaculaceae bacterium]|nr:ATP-binding protein [Muribaculaceae bacterium]